MLDEFWFAPADEQAVREGMLLAVRDERLSRVKYDLWAVKRVGRLTQKGHVTVTLISAERTLQAEATATFPDGVVRDPWRVVWFSEGDRKQIWEGAGRDGQEVKGE